MPEIINDDLDRAGPPDETDGGSESAGTGPEGIDAPMLDGGDVEGEFDGDDVSPNLATSARIHPS